MLLNVCVHWGYLVLPFLSLVVQSLVIVVYGASWVWPDSPDQSCLTVAAGQGGHGQPEGQEPPAPFDGGVAEVLTPLTAYQRQQQQQEAGSARAWHHRHGGGGGDEP